MHAWWKKSLCPRGEYRCFFKNNAELSGILKCWLLNYGEFMSSVRDSSNWEKWGVLVEERDVGWLGMFSSVTHGRDPVGNGRRLLEAWCVLKLLRLKVQSQFEAVASHWVWSFSPHATGQAESFVGGMVHLRLRFLLVPHWVVLGRCWVYGMGG